MTRLASLPQAVVVRDARGPRLTARSPGFTFDHEEAALGVAVRFGPRPPGVRCPEAVFAVPLGPTAVTVVQAADLSGEADPPLGFRFVVFDRRLYEWVGDPFLLADCHPANWSPRAALPDLDWETDHPPPRRPVADVQRVLKEGDGPSLLGTAQALLDGARLAVHRTAPDPAFVRGVWQLLPDRVRAELRPATFAFAAELGFHLVALPTPPPAGYLTEGQAKDYPAGRYELALQVAAEDGDQAELDRLFARKTSKDVLRLAVALVAFALLVAAVLKFL